MKIAAHLHFSIACWCTQRHRILHVYIVYTLHLNPLINFPAKLRNVMFRCSETDKQNKKKQEPKFELRTLWLCCETVPSSGGLGDSTVNVKTNNIHFIQSSVYVCAHSTALSTAPHFIMYTEINKKQNKTIKTQNIIYKCH